VASTSNHRRCAPRSASIPSALNRLRILPVAAGMFRASLLPLRKGFNTEATEVGAQRSQRVRHLLVIQVNPFAGKVLGKRRNFIGELCERIEPGTNLFWRAERKGSLAASLSGKNFLDIGLDLDSSCLCLRSDLVGNLDLDFHRKTLARRMRETRLFGQQRSSVPRSRAGTV